MLMMMKSWQATPFSLSTSIPPLNILSTRITTMQRSTLFLSTKISLTNYFISQYCLTQTQTIGTPLKNYLNILTLKLGKNGNMKKNKESQSKLIYMNSSSCLTINLIGTMKEVRPFLLAEKESSGMSLDRFNGSILTIFLSFKKYSTERTGDKSTQTLMEKWQQEEH